MNYFPEVIHVIPVADYTVSVYLDDGSIKLYNAKELVIQGIFTPLQGIEKFKNICVALNRTLAWAQSNEDTINLLKRIILLLAQNAYLDRPLRKLCKGERAIKTYQIIFFYVEKVKYKMDTIRIFSWYGEIISVKTNRHV